MNSNQCRAINCPYFGKFSGKAVCRATAPKKYIKHLQQCPQVLTNEKAKENARF